MENNAVIIQKTKQVKQLRPLPRYTRGEEIFNMISHIVGVALGFVVLFLCTTVAAKGASTAGVVGSIIFGITVIALYTMSSIYHGMKDCAAKRVLQVLDHCTIYLLIAGTYTPILISSIAKINSTLAYSYLAIEWGLAAGAIALTAVDMNKYKGVSMVFYLLLGWGIIAFSPLLIQAMTIKGFMLILSGGIVYTVGSVIYGLGRKYKNMHSIFHVFCIAGTLLHFLAVVLYCL